MNMKSNSIIEEMKHKYEKNWMGDQSATRLEKITSISSQELMDFSGLNLAPCSKPLLISDSRHDQKFRGTSFGLDQDG